MSVNLPPSPGGGPTEHAVEHALAPVEAGATQATTEAAADTRGTSVWGAAFQRLRRNPAAIAGAVIVLLFVLVAVLAPVLAPYAGTATPGMREIRPTHVPGPGEVAGYPLGLDRFGGDVLSKLIWGAQASLLIGVISTAFGLAGGMLLGLLAGTFGGWVDSVVMRVVDILLSVPNLLLAVSIAAILGQTPFAVMIAIGVAQVPVFARLLRSSMLTQKGSDYVLAAQTLGLSRGRITMSHVLPSSRVISSIWSRITCCTVTSRAEVGSSAISTLGPQASAMAIITRWRMPPDSWCGKRSSTPRASGMRTSSSMRRASARAALRSLC